MTEESNATQQPISQKTSKESLSSLASQKEHKASLKQFWKGLLRYLETGHLEPKQSVETSKSTGSRFFSLRSKKSSKKELVTDVEKPSVDLDRLSDVFWLEIQFDFPDLLINKYLRARKFEVEQSLEMFINTLNWLDRKDHFKIKRLGENLIKTDYLRSEELYFLGTDLENRPVCYAHAKLHDPTALSVEEQEDFALWLMETARLLLTDGEMVTIVFDLTDMKYANMDMSAVKVLISCLGSYFPESLGKILVLNAPWFFSSIWKMIKTLLDPVVANKTTFLDTNQLKEHIDPSQISSRIDPVSSMYKYQYLEPSDTENSFLKDDNKKNEIKEKFLAACKEFKDKTVEWINTDDEALDTELQNQRLEVAKVLSECYCELDPYLRARTVYHRLGVIKGIKQVDWSALSK